MINNGLLVLTGLVSLGWLILKYMEVRGDVEKKLDKGEKVAVKELDKEERVVMKSSRWVGVE